MLSTLHFLQEDYSIQEVRKVWRSGLPNQLAGQNLLL